MRLGAAKITRTCVNLGILVRTKPPYDELNDLRPIDPAGDSRNWDRRRRGETRANAARSLERAAMHLIEDQMSGGRTYSPGALDAVHLLRKCIAAIEADELMYQRAGRAVASWLPKHVLARQIRDGISDA